MTFTPDQTRMLDDVLDKRAVKTREQSGRKLSYIEGWFAIAEANRILGFDGWTSETVDIRCVAEHPRKVGKPPNQRDGHGVSYVAKVRVTVGDVIREGVGSGHGIDTDIGLAHESAIKEAETDARKRALMTFGNPFGLALYDKTMANVGIPEEPPAEDAGPTESEKRIAELLRVGIGQAATTDELKSWWMSDKTKDLRRQLPADLHDAVKADFVARGRALTDGAEPVREPLLMAG